jgi:secondary thiamine-phosphate synthase enzyme
MEIHVGTNDKRQIVDITAKVTELIQGQGKGAVLVFVQHTTAAITTADLDPGTDLDFLDALDGLLPKREWRHPHNPAHAPDHLLASIIGPSVIVPYHNDKLLLGAWQRIVLVELDGSRDRTITIQVLPALQTTV